MKKRIFSLVLVFALLFSLYSSESLQVKAATEAKYIYDAAVLANGTIAALYISEGTVYYGNYNPATSVWNKTEVAVGKDCALYVDSADVPHIAYITADDNLGYTCNSGSGWSTPEIIDSVAFDGTDGALTAPDIVVDNNGYVHLTYFDAKGGYEGGNNYSSYEKPDLMYATNASGSFVKSVRSYSHGWFYSPDGWRNLAMEPAKITYVNGNYWIGLLQYNYDKDMSTQYHTYNYNILTTPATPSNDLNWQINSSSINNSRGFKLFDIDTDGTNAYTLCQKDGNLYVTNDVTEIAAATKTAAVSGADLTVNSGGNIYYAGINGSSLLLYQNGNFKESLALPVSIGAHTRITTVCDSSSQYVLYTDTGGVLQIADVSLASGDTDVGTFAVPDLVPVTISGVAVNNKTYDGNAAAYTGTPSAVETASGNSVSVSAYDYSWYDVTNDVALSAAPSEVGSYKLTVSVAESDGTYTGSKEIPFTIQPATLTISGVAATNRDYNGTTTVHITGGALNGLIDGDNVSPTVPATGSIAAAAAGNNKAVTLATITLTGDDADNYTLTQPTGLTVDITPATLTIASVTTEDKTYDGSATATVSAISFNGLQNSETLTATTDYSITAAFSDSAAGNNKSVNITVTLCDTEKANNYTLADESFSDTASIAKATGLTATKPDAINVVKNLQKTYQYGLTSIALNKTDTGDVTYSLNLLSGDDIFDTDPAVNGNNLDFTAAQVSSGTATQTLNIHCQNYQNITVDLDFVLVDRKAVTISGVTVADKTYDGKAVTYTGTPVAAETDGGATADIDEYTYTWYQGATPLTTAPKNAGSYMLKIAVDTSDETYRGETELPFTIAKKELTVKPKDKTIYTNAPFPTLEVSYDGLIPGESAVDIIVFDEPLAMKIQNDDGTPLADASINGTYPIVITNQPSYDCNNYEVVWADGVLIIQSEVTVTVETQGDTTTVLPLTAVDQGFATTTLSDIDANVILAEIAEEDTAKLMIESEVDEDLEGINVALPKSVAEEMANRKGTLTISTPLGDIILGQNALQAITGITGDTMSCSIINNNDNTIAVEIKVGDTVLQNMGGIKVNLPLILAPDDVPIIIGKDHSETIVKKSTATANGFTALLAGSATLKVVNHAGNSKDISNDYWAKDSIAFVTSHELFFGTSETKFSPGMTMNRAMFATVLYRLEESPAVDEGTLFTDVPANTWYTKGVYWAAQNNIVMGTGNNRFEPEKKITREEMAVMIYRYCSAVGYDTSMSGDLSSFIDGATVSSWAKTAMSYAVGTGLICGKSSNRIDPQAGATRAEAATILQRLIGVLVA